MAVRPVDWRAIRARNTTNPINRRPPTRFPYLEELMRDRDVRAALNSAWRDTNADARPITAASEQDGWIFMDLQTGRLTIQRKYNPLRAPARPGENAPGYLHIRLYPVCPIVPGSILVGIFHTHPSEPFTGASDDDERLGTQQGVPGIVRGQPLHGSEQYDFTGPEGVRVTLVRPRSIPDSHPNLLAGSGR